MAEIKCKDGEVIVPSSDFDLIAQQTEEEVDPHFIGALEDTLKQYTCSLLCQHGCHAKQSSPEHVKGILFSAFQTAQNLPPSDDKLVM